MINYSGKKHLNYYNIVKYLLSTFLWSCHSQSFLLKNSEYMINYSEKQQHLNYHNIVKYLLSIF